MAELIERVGTRLLDDFYAVRRRSVGLAEPLSEEDCCAQSMPDASPVKWHLAHTSWFFETFILERHEPDFRPHHPAFRMLFNSYYNGIGDKHVRAQRGLITRPSFDEVLAYRHAVDERIAALLERDSGAEIGALIRLGLQHEQQHQELLLTDVKHLLAMNPLLPAYRDEALPHARQLPPLEWLAFEGGIVEIGHDGGGFAFDNESPRHRQFVEPFALASRLVANGDYLAFIEDGGYRDAALWLSEGWDWVGVNGLQHPLYWRQGEEGWSEFTLHGLQPLDAARPVTHLSYFEADAYARWADARLPTEAEWEHAARSLNMADDVPRGLHPNATSGSGITQLFGDCWQWTSSSYAPYPGFAPAAGAIGEYNGKFMCNQYVLRGSSCATPAGHARASYRNFFPSSARWQFSGIRLARSC
ncbi:ergothioneine biosynthesis protein EgtB [Noviherbaspirillum pedocola]|uniref:Ergothioneine biosynthesis protein EgtB n=1 Tax=Noviherbaspirillum pedocola TaxID=2801341 RepID=A0A934T216_9BURK|nr:ergothioneine biosynthesis protein EgtB [Noviherbaspirillum pedocola]MBK4737504.1 ergothioneine biosynthesis protein EgtB [Noviherbaspirillum pedocola]